MNGLSSKFELSAASLDALMPMHLWVTPTGHIRSAGRTLSKIIPQIEDGSCRLLEVFEFHRPRNIGSMADLAQFSQDQLRVRLRNEPFTVFKGLVVPLTQPEGLLMNLSFGISVIDAVRDFELSNADFSATDLAVELLYLVEAKAAVLAESRDLNTRLDGARIAAEEQAFSDTLTGLRNRRALDHILARLCERNGDFALVQLDLDYFKRVNDTLGHAAGDHVLQQVAKILNEETRPEDTVARVGGDEFVLIFDGLTDPSKLKSIGNRIISRLEVPFEFGEQTCRISGSMGVTITDCYESIDEATILADADAALYASKDMGRGRVSVHGFLQFETSNDQNLGKS